MFLALKEVDLAEEMLQLAIRTAEADPDRALPRYNLGILRARDAGTSDGLELIEAAISSLPERRSEARLAAVLIAPKLEEGEVRYREIRGDLDLLEVARSAAEILRTVHQ